MRVRTFAIVAGSKACNGSCPFCVAKMTPSCGVSLEKTEFNWRNFNKAALLAERDGSTTVLITGKGEPTLFPDQISQILTELQKHRFPIIELQTNGILFDTNYKKYKKYLDEWHSEGLDIISLSLCHYDDKKNAEIVGTKIDLAKVIDRLHKHGFSVRITCMLMKDYIDSIEEVLKTIKFAKDLGVEQLSFRELGRPYYPENKDICSWVNKHVLPKKVLQKIRSFVEKNASKLMDTEYGLTIYDYKGQNVGMTNCLTIDSEGEKVRQLIYFPDGHVRFDWQYEGAILL